MPLPSPPVVKVSSILISTGPPSTVMDWDSLQPNSSVKVTVNVSVALGCTSILPKSLITSPAALVHTMSKSLIVPVVVLVLSVIVSSSQDTIVFESEFSSKVISPETVPSASTSMPISSGTTTVTVSTNSQTSMELLSVMVTK